jgi:hypothetical protein
MSKTGRGRRFSRLRLVYESPDQSRTVINPVVPGVPAHFVDALEVPRLIERYRQDYGLDVTDDFHRLSQDCLAG